MKWPLLKTNTRLFNVCVCRGGGGEGERFIPWVFEPEIFNLSPLGITLQVISTVAYWVKEVGQM